MEFCKVCDLKLAPGNQHTCSECGEVFCSDHISDHNHESEMSEASEDVKYCSNCGEQLDVDAQYCERCGAAASGAAPSDTTAWPLGKKVTVVSSVIVAAGAFLPWISVSVLGTSASKRGIQADGIITLIAAILILLIAAWRWGPWQRGVSFFFGLIILGLGAMYIYDPLIGVRDQLTAQQREFQNLVSPGIGLYLTAIGGFLILLGISYDTWFNAEWRS